MFAVTLACIYPFIRNVDDLFNISKELFLVTVAIVCLAGETPRKPTRTASCAVASTELRLVLMWHCCACFDVTFPARLSLLTCREFSDMGNAQTRIVLTADMYTV